MRRPGALAVRDAAITVVALAGVVYETLIDHVDRPALLTLFAAMLGTPLFLRRDETHQPEKRRAGEHDDE